MAVDKIKAPPLIDDLKPGRFLAMFKFFGPGAIMASLTIGSGETFFASRGGAVFGYYIIWAFFLGCLFKWAQCYSAMRYLTLTGDHPINAWTHFPGPRGWFPFLIAVLSILCFPFWLAFLPSLLGDLCNWMLGFWPREVWGTIWLLVAIAMTILGGYDVLEKVQLILVSILIVVIIFSVFWFGPDWGAVLVGSVVPRIPDYAPWIIEKYPEVAARSPWVEVATYVGAIGGGTYDYIGYIGLLREKGWGVLGLPNIDEIEKKIFEVGDKGEKIPLSEEDSEVKNALGWLKAAKIDSIVSFVAVAVFAAGFMIGGARVLHTQELIPAGKALLQHQAKFLTDIHPLLLYIYDAGVFLAIAGTIYGAFEVYTRTVYEVLRAVFVGMRDVKVEKVRPWVLLYVGLGGITLMWVIKLTGANLIVLPTAAGIIGGTMTCGLWCLAMIWTDRKFLPKAYQMGTGLVVLNVIGGLFMAIMGLVAWWEFGVGKMGGFSGGLLAYLFLVAMVGVCMIVMTIINSRYRRKGLIA